MVAVPLDPLPPALFQTHPDLQDPQTGRSVGCLICHQERMMTSLFFHGGGGRACDWQKFKTGGISGVY